MLTATDPTIDEFTAFLSERVPPASASTIEGYTTDSCQLFRYLDDRGLDWRDLTTATLREYLAHLTVAGLAPTSVDRKRASAHAIGRFLAANGVLTHAPGISGGYVLKSTQRPLQPSDWAKLRRELARDDSPCGGRDAALIAVLASTGWRIGRVLALDLGDVEHLMSWELDDLGIEALHSYLTHDRPRLTTDRERRWRPAFSPALFVNHNGSRLTRQGVARRLAELGAAAGVDRLRADLVRLSGQTSRVAA